MSRPYELPEARALREGSRLIPRGPSFRRRLSYVSRRIKPGYDAMMAHLVGLLPLVVVLALALGLVWGSALGASP